MDCLDLWRKERKDSRMPSVKIGDYMEFAQLGRPLFGEHVLVVRLEGSDAIVDNSSCREPLNTRLYRVPVAGLHRISGRCCCDVCDR